MFSKLHLQLTTLCISITGLVLAVLTAVCLMISESDIRSTENSSFEANLNVMYQNLEQQVSLSHNWIRQMENSCNVSIRIFDNGMPLFFQSLEQTDIPDSLWEKTCSQALSEYGIDLWAPVSLGILAQHREFTVCDKNKKVYAASVALIPRAGGNIGVAILHSLSDMNQRIWEQRIAFLAADLAALVLLGVFYWFFTARMIRPLRENQKKQIQFVASASHELRSPLTVILSNVAAVKNGIMPNDRQFLNTIYSEGNRMSRLISDMLQLAGADNHTWSIHPSGVELDTLLLETWENYESMAAARQLRWEITLPENAIPRCTCDPQRIRQLLSILIDNAFCYTPAGGTVRLVLRENTTGTHAPGSFSVSVIDNGPGIPDEQKNAVFERFQRLDTSRSDKSHFGLGLCIAREIAVLHKGKLLLSDTPGGGATFTFILPKG